MARMASRAGTRGYKSGCAYGNHCCPSVEYLAGHATKRRTLKRGERQAWKRALREGREV